MQRILKFRYVSWVAVITSWLAAVLVFFIGAKKFVELSVGYFRGELGTAMLDSETYVIVKLLEIVDAFLFGLVLIIFAFGVYQLFISRLPQAESEESRIPWQNINNLTQLKTIIGEVMLLMLIVLFVKNSFLAVNDYAWDHLILPISIFLIGATIWLWKSSGNKGH